MHIRSRRTPATNIANGLNKITSLYSGWPVRQGPTPVWQQRSGSQGHRRSAFAPDVDTLQRASLSRGEVQGSGGVLKIAGQEKCMPWYSQGGLLTFQW